MEQLELSFLSRRVARKIPTEETQVQLAWAKSTFDRVVVVGLGIGSLMAGLATGMVFWRLILGPW